MFKIFDINGKKIGDIILFCLYCVCFLGVEILWGIKKVWGDFDLSTISLVVTRGMDANFSPVIIWCVGGALVLGAIGISSVVFWVFNKFEKKENRDFSLRTMTWFLFLFFGGAVWFLRGVLDREIFFQLYLGVVCGYLVIQKREFVRGARWMMLFLFVLGFVVWGNYKNDFTRLVVNYDDYFVEKTEDLVMKNKRNLIVIFAESFENRFSEIEFRGVKNRVKDEDAVKFSYFLEGKLQGTTIEALSAAINGVHIGNEGKYFEYFLIKNKLNKGEIGDVRELGVKNKLGVGHILASNGYKNIFVKGASIKFMKTDGFLLREGFDRENIYDTKAFEGWGEFIDKQKEKWWGPSDKDVMEKFKEKILSVEKGKPFFAVMFTCDLHARLSSLYKNPFFDSDEEIINATIDNLNNFVDWFKKQEWYENTSLVIIADHRKMGNPNRKRKEKLYNAFFNVPEELKKDLKVERKFNQVDMAPTLLELAGVKLKKRRYGVGVSLFSKNKTIAERYSYEKQKEMFSKIDKFYQRIWSAKSFIFGGDVIKDDVKEKFIAHAGGVIDGNIYTNSLEAMEKSKQRGYKYIELDLIVNGYSKDKIIGAHDCDRFYKMSLKKCDEEIDVEKDKLLGKYSILDDERILEFFIKNEDLWLVTDKIDDFKLLDEKFGKIKNRMLVEVFSFEKYLEARKFGFENIALNVKNKKDVEVALDRGIEMVTMELGFAKNNEREILRLRNNGIKILGYTAKNFNAVKKLEGKIDMFYYDGEEEIEAYFR